jgi:hypothetical protein
VRGEWASSLPFSLDSIEHRLTQASPHILPAITSTLSTGPPLSATSPSHPSTAYVDLARHVAAQLPRARPWRWCAATLRHYLPRAILRHHCNSASLDGVCRTAASERGIRCIDNTTGYGSPYILREYAARIVQAIGAKFAVPGNRVYNPMQDGCRAASWRQSRGRIVVEPTFAQPEDHLVSGDLKIILTSRQSRLPRWNAAPRAGSQVFS